MKKEILTRKCSPTATSRPFTLTSQNYVRSFYHIYGLAHFLADCGVRQWINNYSHLLRLGIWLKFIGRG